MSIHPTAIVAESASIDPSAIIGPYTVIEDDVVIGPDTKVMAGCYIYRRTEIGKSNMIHPGAVLGDAPQIVGQSKGAGAVRIGDSNVIREHFTVHRSKEPDGVTLIGNDNYFMSSSHVAHDCVVGNNVIMAPGALLGGHVTIEDHVFLSGNAMVHQFMTVGTLAFLAGAAKVSLDVPPYVMIDRFNEVRGLNSVGMRRRGMTQEQRTAIKRAYKLLFYSDLNTTQALAKLEEMEMTPEVKGIVEFVKSSSRGICKARKRETGDTTDSVA